MDVDDDKVGDGDGIVLQVRRDLPLRLPFRDVVLRLQELLN